MSNLVNLLSLTPEIVNGKVRTRSRTRDNQLSLIIRSGILRYNLFKDPSEITIQVLEKIKKIVFYNLYLI